MVIIYQPEDNLQVSILSFLCVSTRDHTDAVNFGSKSSKGLYPGWQMIYLLKEE